MTKTSTSRLRRWAAPLLALACLSGKTLTLFAQTPIRASMATQVSSEALTLPLAVEIAMRTNPLTRATASGREIADARLSEARAGRFPVIQISESVMNGNNPVFVFGSLLEQARFRQQNFDLRSLNNPDPLNNFRFSLTIKAPLYDQRQAATRVNQAQFGRRQADAETDATAQRIRFETLRAFYGVLLARANKEVADEAVKLAEADVKRSRDRVEAGAAVASDLLSAEVQLADFRQRQIEAEGEIITAQAALNTALGLPINTPQQVTGQLVEKAFNLADQGELIRQALRDRPDYLRAALSLRSSAEQVKGARGEYLPRVDVFASAGASRNNWVGGSGDYIVGASVTFNLFDAGRNARINQARAAESLAASQQEHLANQIRLEVVRAYQQFVSARERVKVAERVIAHATEALRIVQDRYNEGLTTITETLRAETALARAQSNLLSARYDYYVGYAALLLASGRLTDVEPFVS